MVVHIPDPVLVPIFGSQMAGSQDGLVTRRQALQQLTEDELRALLGHEWVVVLPGVYLTTPGSITKMQRRRAALLRAGGQAMLTDLDALDLYGVPGLPLDRSVHVLVPDAVKRTSKDFLVIRRTPRFPPPRQLRGFPVAPPERALADFVRRHGDGREALAVAASALQRRTVDRDVLVEEALRGPARGRPRLARVIEKLDRGVRSVPEDDLRTLVLRSRVLPEPLWNCLLELPDGKVVSPDALFVDAALVHETNGRQFHAGYDEFEDMQRRHDAMVAAGLVVLHNSPRRIANEARAVVAQIEACYQRNAGRGLPAGVTLVRRGPA